MFLANQETKIADGDSTRAVIRGGLYSQSLSKVLCRMRELTDTVPPKAPPPEVARRLIEDIGPLPFCLGIV